MEAKWQQTGSKMATKWKQNERRNEKKKKMAKLTCVPYPPLRGQLRDAPNGENNKCTRLQKVGTREGEDLLTYFTPHT